MRAGVREGRRKEERERENEREEGGRVVWVCDGCGCVLHPTQE